MSVGQERRPFWVLFILPVTLQMVTGLLMAWGWAGLLELYLADGLAASTFVLGERFWPWRDYSLPWPRRCGQGGGMTHMVTESEVLVILSDSPRFICVVPHGHHRLPQPFLKAVAMHMQLAEQATEFLARSALPYLKDFLSQGLHRFMLGQQGLYPRQFRRVDV